MEGVDNVLSQKMGETRMATYYARMLDAETNGEGAYTFEGPADLIAQDCR